MRSIWALLAVALVGFSGCISTVETFYGFEADDQYRNPGVLPGTYSFGNGGSVVQAPGLLQAGQPEIIHLVSEVPAFPGGTSDGEVRITMAVWRPENFTEPVPIIIDAGPYYEQDEHCEPNPNQCQEVVEDSIDYPAQMTPFALKNFLPHGYAVAQIAVRGTGTSGGCMDLLGADEQADLNQAINHLANQPWSNGNVAMMGVSYDGTTPWLAAASGNPHLKTIVPISGLPSIHDLMFRNGTVETRGPIMYHQVYWPFGFSDEFPAQAVWDLLDLAGVASPIGKLGHANDRTQVQDLQNLLCPTVVEALAATAAATFTGVEDPATQFWQERDYRQRVIDNYEGSIFLIHGLQDWNVDPHAVIPFNEDLRAAGIPLKEWYGQWGHSTPDGACWRSAPDWAVMPCRLDYAELLLRWFDTYLKDSPRETGPDIQVQDNVGYWRNVDAFPSMDTWESRYLQGETLTSSPGPEESIQVLPGLDGPLEVFRFTGPALEEELRLSGMPQLRFDFQMEGEGGFLGAWLLEVNDQDLARAPYVGCPEANVCVPYGIPVVGHGQVNLLYASGELAPAVPLQRTTGTLEFEPLDVLISPGNHLELWLFQYQYPDHYGSFTPSAFVLYTGTAELRLPVHNVRDVDVFPVPGAHFLNDTYVREMYALKPSLPAPLPEELPVTLLPSVAGAASQVDKIEVL